MKNDFYIERDDILTEAVDKCLKEMFAKSQPAADLDNINAEYKAGKIDEDKEGPIYNRHYLSQEEYTYIINKYISAYRIGSEWRNDVELVESYLKEGGSKDKYIESYTDENGNFHSGYRGFEKVQPIKNQIKDILSNYINDNNVEDITDKVCSSVFETIDNCKNFYYGNRDEMKFRNTIAMTCSPTCNKETVKKWWKDNYNVDIEIEDRNPLLFWDYDYYDEDELNDIMKDEYGDNWKDHWWKEYEKDKELKKKEQEKKIEELRKQNPEFFEKLDKNEVNSI